MTSSASIQPFALTRKREIIITKEEHDE